MKLSDLDIGAQATVLRLDNFPKIKRRLNELGVTAGVKVSVVRKAPFNDPIEIKIRNFYLAIRKSEADKIIVGRL